MDLRTKSGSLRSRRANHVIILLSREILTSNTMFLK